ncbi:LysR family transcriptional regulator [Aliidiomarina quisquiliarum]|uniref:LysR family transcriptional regulator n=1 Tax=Aliidiomarina quisquiliarum TaxID=2938947 RepID=UPI00208E9560|nr:LysR family transcriptional regulator [Aliidiomarina quisquiliarum]MCO4321500.1 LysR family transcriptional regulator [Aliidiomarina quisquiliarum]
MNYWALKVLHTVIEKGSLQAAAAVLHRTSPALSMTLTKLEEEVGFAILDRSGYRLQLTPNGALFMRHGQEILRQQERLNSVVKQLKEGVEPQLRIGIDAGISVAVVREVVANIQQQFPVTEVRVSGCSQLTSLQRLTEGEEHLAISPWLPTFQQMADFETTRIGQYDIVVVIGKALVEQVGLPNSREALSELPYVLPQEMQFGINPEKIYRMPGRSPVRVNDVHTLVNFIEAGMGWGAAPRQLIAESLAKGSLLEINVPGFLDHMHAEYHLVKMASLELGPAGRLFWQHFVDKEQKD